MNRVLVKEPIDISITRASTAIRTLETEMALYFSDGRLRASQKESVHHEKRVLVNTDGLVGIYKKGCEISQIYDDIAEFYK